MTGDLLMPPVYDVIWSVVVLAHAVLLTAALVRWFRRRGAGAGELLDLLVLLLVPLLGPAAYLLAGRRADARVAGRRAVGRDGAGAPGGR